MLRRGRRTPIVVCAALVAAAGAVTPAAALGKSIHVHDSGHLGFKSDEATAIVDEGRLTGSMPGSGRVVFDYTGSPKVKASFTIRASGGAIYGKGTCTLHDPTSAAPSFHGALTITGGSGRYAHAHGSGELYGVFYRHGYALSVQAVGQLNY
jgi:hypothetical protein